MVVFAILILALVVAFSANDIVKAIDRQTEVLNDCDEEPAETT